MTIQTKVTILFFCLTSVVIFLLSGFIFLFANYYAFEDFYKRLETRVRIAQSIDENRENENSLLAQKLRQEYLEKLPSEKEYFIELTAEKKMMDVYPMAIPKKLLEDILSAGKARYRQDNTFFAGSLYQNSTKSTIVIVSATDPYGLSELNHLNKILIIGFLVAIIVVYVIGNLFSYYTFRPIRELITNIQSISAENLHLRLQTKQAKDEISILGQTFNDMLTRLETAFETQNNFVSNASHELRTPLTIIKGEAELALRQPGLGELHQQSVQIILDEANKLNYMLTSLLGLAQSGFDGKKQNWEIARMDELIWLVKEAVDLLYPQNKIKIDFEHLPENEDQLKVYGNITLLKLAVSNVVINACKYSYNQLVIVSLSCSNNQVIIGVKDLGIGIPKQELRFVFEPFFRASNTSDFEGHGIGLPLSLNIIRLHKGNITIDTKEGEGTNIQILLPVASLNQIRQEKASLTSPSSL